MPSTLLLPLPLPADEVKLGSFLLNPSDPTQDYFDPQEEDPGLKPSILRVDVTEFTNTIRDAGSKEVEAVLIGYFSPTIDWTKSKSLELSSAKAATYLLRNSGYWFEQACALPRARWWFEWVTRQSHKIYLLVGLRTIVDGRFKVEHSASTSTGGQIKVPADVLAGLPPIGLDIGGGGKVSKDQAASSEFNAAGERIWALQYRQIKFKWYSSKTVENAALETGTRWVTFNRSDHIMWSGCRDDSTVVPVSMPVSRDRSKVLLEDNVAGKTGIFTPSVKPPYLRSFRYCGYPSGERREEPASELLEEPPSELLEESPSELLGEPRSELLGEPASELLEEPPSELIKEPAGGLKEEPTSELKEEPPSELMEGSAGELKEEPAEELKTTPVEVLTCKPLVKDTEDMVEAFMDDELDLEDQFEVQNTSEETLFIARKVESGGQPLLPPIIWPKAMLLRSQLRTAVDDLEEDVELSGQASIIGRAEHLE